jgi:ADP-ribose diphosphatase
MSDKPKILNQRIIARSRLFRVEELHLQFSNGTKTQYERLLGSDHGAVLIIPVMEDGTVLLVREYAAGTGRYELGLPKGRIEYGEDLLEAANREIKEEIGYGARSLTQLTSLTLAPGYFSHTTHIVLAQELYPERLAGDEPEPLEIVPWPLSGLAGLMTQEDLTEARSIAALFLAQNHLSENTK